MNESMLQAIWRVVTAPMRLLLLWLLWVFAADGSPMRVLGLILGMFVLAQLIQYLSGGQLLLAHH